MDRYATRLADLIAAADAAYQRARVELYDILPAGARIDIDAMSPAQRDAFDELIIAEAELASFRQTRLTDAADDADGNVEDFVPMPRQSAGACD